LRDTFLKILLNNSILFFDDFSKTGSGKIALPQRWAEALKRLGLTAH
jgi:hypothetical protein